MKKKILLGFAVIAIATATTWNVNLVSKSEKLSDISLANKEAKAF